MVTIRHTSTETEVRADFIYHKVQGRDPILSDEARVVLEMVFFVALCGPLSVLGSAVNIVNIIVFLKQSSRDFVSISLCSLALSDLCSLLPLLWISICFNPLFQYSDIDFDSVEMHYLTGEMPNSRFVRISGLITAFIAFERCVCIALPLKVKTIITPKRTLISIVTIFLIVFATTVPLFFTIYLAPSFNAKRNKTLVGVSYKQNVVIFGNFSYSFGISIQLFSFIIIIICTVILVMQLLVKSQWRHKAVSTWDVSDSISVRDKRVMKMVAFMSSIFTICYCPNVANLTLAIYLSPEYSRTGWYRNSYMASWAIIDTIQGINSSIHILIYYNMSSKFRVTFKELFFKAAKLDRKDLVKL